MTQKTLDHTASNIKGKEFSSYMTICSDKVQSRYFLFHLCHKYKWLIAVRAELSQLYFKLFLSSSSINNIHLVDNLLLPLMFLSQLYQFIPQCYIFPEKESNIVRPLLHVNLSKLIYNVALILSPSLIIIMNLSAAVLVWVIWKSISKIRILNYNFWRV